MGPRQDPRANKGPIGTKNPVRAPSAVHVRLPEARDPEARHEELRDVDAIQEFCG